MRLEFKLILASFIITAIILIAYFAYNKYMAAKATECSQLVYNKNPLLYAKYYCFEDIIGDISTKLADTNNKLDTLGKKDTSKLSPDMAKLISDGIICLQNYKTYLEMMYDKYNVVSRTYMEQDISAICGKYYPVDKSIAKIPINCKSILLQGISLDDLKPDIPCPMFTS